MKAARQDAAISSNTALPSTTSIPDVLGIPAVCAAVYIVVEDLSVIRRRTTHKESAGTGSISFGVNDSGLTEKSIYNLLTAVFVLRKTRPSKCLRRLLKVLAYNPMGDTSAHRTTFNSYATFPGIQRTEHGRLFCL